MRCGTIGESSRRANAKTTLTTNLPIAEVRPMAGAESSTRQWTKETKLEWQRIQRAKTGNAYTKKYEHSKKGKLMRTYRNMLSRVTGIQKHKHHLYEGKELLGREEFYEWAMSCAEFHRLFNAWEASGYSRKLAPSVDRIDSSRGYALDNMEWVTHSENSRRGSISKARVRREFK